MLWSTLSTQCQWYDEICQHSDMIKYVNTVIISVNNDQLINSKNSLIWLSLSTVSTPACRASRCRGTSSSPARRCPAPAPGSRSSPRSGCTSPGWSSATTRGYEENSIKNREMCCPLMKCCSTVDQMCLEFNTCFAFICNIFAPLLLDVLQQTSLESFRKY